MPQKRHHPPFLFGETTKTQTNRKGRKDRKGEMKSHKDTKTLSVIRNFVSL